MIEPPNGRILIAGDTKIETTGLAWAAGFFDGEGSTQSDKRNRGVSISITQNDRELLDKFAVIFGFGIVRGPYGPYTGRPSKPNFRYYAFGFEHVQAVVAMMWPWLGTAKRKQAREALVLYRDNWKPRGWKPFKTHCARGHERTSDNLRLIRHKDGTSQYRCKLCEQEDNHKQYEKRHSNVS